MILFVLPLVGLVGGLAWLLHLRFESGQAYPQRSSLRADPLGSKALHDAYAEMPGLEVSRNLVPFVQRQALSPEATLLLLNLHGREMHALADYGWLVDFVEGGGHLVVALNPAQIAYRYVENEPEDSADGSEAGEPAPEEGADTGAPKKGFTRRPQGEEAEAFWAGLSLRVGEHEGGSAVRAEGLEFNLPSDLPWREGGVLVEGDSEVWKSLYQIGDEVVAAERAFGAGRIVVLTDDYLFSNEALLKHRFTNLLSWVLGGQSTLIFEETHLGIAESAGVATLIRRYRLGGFALAFFGVLGLIVWRESRPFLPVFEGRGQDAVIRSEHSVEAGLGELIQRSLDPSDLPERAYREWERTFLRTAVERRKYAAETAEIEALLAAQKHLSPRQRRPWDTHFKIKSIIQRKQRSSP